MKTGGQTYLNPIKNLNALIINKETKFKPFSESDSIIVWKYKNQIFELVSDEEGQINDIFPLIKTNVDSCNKGHCYFYANDNFGGNGRKEYSINELYIDLVKAESKISIINKCNNDGIVEDDFDKRFDEQFGTGTDIFDVDEYMKE